MPTELTGQFLHFHQVNFQNIDRQKMQCGKEVVSDYMGLEDFAIGLVNSVLNFPNGHVKFC